MYTKAKKDRKAFAVQDADEVRLRNEATDAERDYRDVLGQWNRGEVQSGDCRSALRRKLAADLALSDYLFAKGEK